MAKKPTRLRFTEDDLADKAVRQAADRAEKAVGKAEKAVEKESKPKKKLRTEADVSKNRSAKLRFEKADIEPELDKPSRGKHIISRASSAAIASKAHQAVSEHEDDNIGVQAVHQSEEAVEAAAYTVDHAVYSKKLKAHDKAEKLIEKSDRANVDALYEKYKKDNPDASTNPISRWRQKQAIKKEYAAARAGKSTAGSTAAASKNAGKAAKETKNVTQKLTDFVTSHSKALIVVGIFLLLFMVIASMFSSCTAMFQGGAQMVLGTSYTATDEDIIGADDDYSDLEAALRRKLNNIERTHSGYDEYRYELDEINHNPYELASYLTVMFEDYTREEVQRTLERLFELQYELTLEEEVEIRTRTETRTETETGTRWVWDDELEEYVEEEYEYEVEVEYEVEYEYYILNVKLTNYGLNYAIANSGMTADEMERYRTLLQTQGNRPDLFEGNIYATIGEYTDYDIPGEALTDVKFARMIREAEKYLGYPYVWGGSSPSTSFDCSGFVSWVLNHSGWNVGRLSAQGLYNICTPVARSNARPGDLVFFVGTYDTPGVSHVGIYAGNSMMIHCGDPITYANINTVYWQSHFYIYGRLP
mgnify:CR=1 FL=1